MWPKCAEVRELLHTDHTHVTAPKKQPQKKPALPTPQRTPLLQFSECFKFLVFVVEVLCLSWYCFPASDLLSSKWYLVLFAFDFKKRMGLVFKTQVKRTTL